MSVYQILVIIICIYFLYQNLVVIFVDNQTPFKRFSHILFWVAVLVIVAFPQLTHAISHLLGMGENLNTLIFTGFVINFIIIFKLLRMVDHLENDITKMVREKALDEAFKRNRNKN